MKTSDRLLEANAIGRASSLLEQLNTRLAAGSRGWREKQLSDWQSLRAICDRMIGKVAIVEVNSEPERDEPLLNDVSKRWDGELNNRPGTEHNP